MPFFSFSLNEIKSSFTKYNITSNNVYFSKNTNLWKLLNKENSSIIKFLKREKRLTATKISKNILFCLPPSIGLGDAIEYAMAIKTLSEKIQFDNLGVAFTGEHEIIFRDFYKISKIYPFIIEKNEFNNFDTVFHLTLEINNLVNQKYSRSNIFEEIINYFNIKKPRQREFIKSNNKIKKISIFPISSSPIRSMPIVILNDLLNLLTQDYVVEICLDCNSKISNYLFNNVNKKNVTLVDPKNKSELISYIKNIQYGLFMDSGPLHVAKMLNKRGLMLETSVSTKILLKNYNLIKGIENNFTSSYCNAPCGLTDIFNYQNSFGCYDSLRLNSLKIKNNNFKDINNRGVKNYYLENFKKPPGCSLSLNVQNIYNAIKKDMFL